MDRLTDAEAHLATDPGRFVFYVVSLAGLALAVIAAQLGAWILTAVAATLAVVAGVEPRLARFGYLRGYSAGWNAGWDDRTNTPRGPRSLDRGQFFSEGDVADTP
jgi:hypothetical protein